MISASSIILRCASIAGISAKIISHKLVTMASSDVARQSCPVSSRCLALVPSPAAWGLWCLWLGRCRGRTADDLPALQHAASDPGQSEPRSRTFQPIRDQFTCSARISAALRPHAALSPWTMDCPSSRIRIVQSSRDIETKNIFCKSSQLETQSSIESSPLSRTL